MDTVMVLSKRDKCPEGYTLIDCTSRNDDPVYRLGLSPFYLSDIPCYDGLISKNLENAWQYSKVYPDMIDADGNPTKDYFSWRDNGFAKSWADRYPKGRGAVPSYSYWKLSDDYVKLGYIDARKYIYIPLYAAAAFKTEGYKRLKDLELEKDGRIALADFDGYNYLKHGMSMKDVVNDETRKMGHGFVLVMMLEEYLTLEDDKLVDISGILK